MTTAARPLDGVRVLELARSHAGPRGGMILSDLGAEVIKIEPPVEEICEMDDPVAGEMYLPGVAVEMSKTRAGSVRCRHPASTPTRSSRACSATTRARSVTCEAPARSRRLARAVPFDAGGIKRSDDAVATLAASRVSPPVRLASSRGEPPDAAPPRPHVRLRLHCGAVRRRSGRHHARRPAARRHDRLRTRVARGAASNGRRGRRRPSLRSRAAPALSDSRPRAARSRLLAS